MAPVSTSNVESTGVDENRENINGPPLRQSQQSELAKAVILKGGAAAMANSHSSSSPVLTNSKPSELPSTHSSLPSLNTAELSVLTNVPNITNITARDFAHKSGSDHLAPPPTIQGRVLQMTTHSIASVYQNGVGNALSDTPAGSAPSTAPASPRLMPIRQNSGTTTPRVRQPATTLNIPGMTRSAVSPDGKIASRDVGAKLVVIMVGLPARGKSYITKKIHRYLSWQQHDTQIFNVGNRRRVAASNADGFGSPPQSPKKTQRNRVVRTESIANVIDPPTQAAHILLNGVDPVQEAEMAELTRLPSAENMEQSAEFFDPHNEKASQLREQVAMETLDELLDFLLVKGGSVGILDATNSTVKRRQILFNHIKRREPKLGILFIESVCKDEKLLETNMRLKLRGPDYKDKDPESSYNDFKKRVAAYESAYAEVGEFEEANNMQYIKLIDVGRKVVHYQLQGFLACGIASYLSTFNLSPRQIWITRHGKSEDNRLGKIGGNSDLTFEGEQYATALYNFIGKKRVMWEQQQKEKIKEMSQLPQAGDKTPPYPELLGDLDEKNFCVWTSMLKRSIQTAVNFQDDDDYDVKNWEMLNELDAGTFEGMTYEEIETKYPEEAEKRSRNKLTYTYPGVGGEGYLQVISRLRDLVRELERIKDHVLIIGHRSVARVLMAYFMDLTRDDIADLDMPLGMLYAIEPKPYGIEFHAYRYNEENFDFDELVGYKPQKQTQRGN